MKIDTVQVWGQRRETMTDEWRFTSRSPLPIGYEPKEPPEPSQIPEKPDKEKEETEEDAPSDGFIPPTDLATPEDGKGGVLGFMAPAGRLMPFDDIVTVTASRNAAGRIAGSFIPVLGLALGAYTLYEVTEAVAQVAGEALAGSITEEINRQSKAAARAMVPVQRGDSTVLQLTPETFLPFSEDALRTARERMHRLAREKVISEEWATAYHETMFQAYEDRKDLAMYQRGYYHNTEADAEEEALTVQDAKTRAHIKRSRLASWDMWQMDIYPEVREQKFRRGHYRNDTDEETEEPADLFERLRQRMPQQVAIEVPDLEGVLSPELSYLPASRLDLNLKSDAKGRIWLQFRNQVKAGNPIKEFKTSVKEARRPRKDAKSRHMAQYLAAMRFVSKTWGRASEWLDRANAAQSNLYLEPGTYFLDGHRFYLRKRTAFDSLTVRQRRDALKGMYEGKIKWDFDKGQFMMDLLVQEATDRAIAAGSRGEEQIMKRLFSDAHPMRNAFGNPSTWASRMSKQWTM